MKYVRKSDLNDLQPLADLVNAAYRGVGGERRWTTEAHLVAGNRLRPEDLKRTISAGETEFILGYFAQKLVCCVAIKRDGDITEFGTFAVDPEYHGLGYGKAMLAYAEQTASSYSRVFQVSVVSQNTDLIAFYRRRGYIETGEMLPYPVELNVGQPMRADLDLTVLQKRVVYAHSGK